MQIKGEYLLTVGLLIINMSITFYGFFYLVPSQRHLNEAAADLAATLESLTKKQVDFEALRQSLQVELESAKADRERLEAALIKTNLSTQKLANQLLIQSGNVTMKREATDFLDSSRIQFEVLNPESYCFPIAQALECTIVMKNLGARSFLAGAYRYVITDAQYQDGPMESGEKGVLFTSEINPSRKDTINPNTRNLFTFRIPKISHSRNVFIFFNLNPTNSTMRALESSFEYAGLPFVGGSLNFNYRHRLNIK